uniref:AlNc14C331G10695 protein n=1 Tax=Albugo laibachii Nc14 TaxID=890382 RepID=F0WWT2_9STRA|nr:AlNc14C331G10695 [Albugo laibachii Nc14]|eukprot:CCA25909.1 AlNc14C331G10695 [Albugo laibachii Nc14]
MPSVVKITARWLRQKQKLLKVTNRVIEYRSSHLCLLSTYPCNQTGAWTHNPRFQRPIWRCIAIVSFDLPCTSTRSDKSSERRSVDIVASILTHQNLTKPADESPDIASFFLSL